MTDNEVGPRSSDARALTRDDSILPMHPMKVKALELRAEGHSIAGAARELGYHRSQIDLWIREADFASKWLEACESKADWFEDRLWHHASQEGGSAVTATIVGLKIAGRFVDGPAVVVNNDNRSVDLSGLTPDQLVAMTATFEAQRAALVEPEVETQA